MCFNAWKSNVFQTVDTHDYLTIDVTEGAKPMQQIL